MPYPKPEEWTLSLDEAGCPELSITFRDPRSLPGRHQVRLQEAAFILARAARGIVPERQDDWAVRLLHDLIPTLIIRWNLPYPEGHPRAGEVIPLDQPDVEPDPFGELPGDVYQLVVREVSRRISQPPKSAGR